MNISTYKILSNHIYSTGEGVFLQSNPANCTVKLTRLVIYKTSNGDVIVCVSLPVRLDAPRFLNYRIYSWWEFFDLCVTNFASNFRRILRSTNHDCHCQISIDKHLLTNLRRNTLRSPSNSGWSQNMCYNCGLVTVKIAWAANIPR